MIYLVISFKPVTNKKIKFGFWFSERHENNIPIVDSNRSISSSNLVEINRGEVCKGANLIFGLKYISPVTPGFNRTVCAGNSILP